MHISKVIIKNFKCFSDPFVLELNDGMNIVVGENEAGKSTILEAINLALSGYIHGRHLTHELSQSLFNNMAVDAYLTSLRTREPQEPPEILIELFFQLEDPSLQAYFEGNGNSLREKASGVQFRIGFSEKYQEQYQIMVDNDFDEMRSLPIEFYEFGWSTFARQTEITPRQLPIKAALVDSSNTRLKSGSDVYISTIVRNYLTEEQKVQVAQVHRKLRESFAASDPITQINEQLKQEDVSEKRVELSVEMSTRDAWESSITTYLDNVPFCNIGKGEQCLIKTKLALRHRKALEASVLLLEEPENHLSHGKLNELLRYIEDNMDGRQVIVSTHSSFVANKLGLENLILINACKGSGKRRVARLRDLREDTSRFFHKLAGYETLRLVLCEEPILVEGPSDELIVQKAYMKYNDGRLPIQDGIDVISVGTSFLRFVEVAEKLGKHVAVVTDNDGNHAAVLEKYESKRNVTLCVDHNDKLRTLEPQMSHANSGNLDNLRRALGIEAESFPDEDSVAEYMSKNKTESALKLFETEMDINFPDYILKAVGANVG